MDISRRKFVGLSFAAAGSVAMGSFMTGCGSAGGEAAAEKTDVVIGLRSDGIDQYLVVEDEIKATGLNPSYVLFDDSVQPDVALAEGSIDCNWYQHEPYMQSYNAENGTEFVMVQPKTAAPLFAMYSSTHKSVDEIPDGATFGMCNDTTNQDRGLHLLESLGLISLPADVEVPSIYDITDDLNPRGFKFIEAEMQVLPQSMADVDAICLAAAHIVNAGMDASSYIAASDDAETYAVGFVVRPEDAEAEWAKTLAEAVQCDDLATYFAEEKQGTMVPMWQ
ncbi:MetQ/NlpA family ABC transporter substrate-binding protein [Slackia heliotrinireducens]|uniref:MetQ/NlpA family ABC transporter substrate-binding protein n=1 Tax=Slackia heliotrinireducens TaxID=84110 RepID=UPI003315336E